MTVMVLVALIFVASVVTAWLFGAQHISGDVAPIRPESAPGSYFGRSAVWQQKPSDRKARWKLPPDDDSGPEEPPVSASAILSAFLPASLDPDRSRHPPGGWIASYRRSTKHVAVAEPDDDDDAIVLWRMRRGTSTIKALVRVNPHVSQLEIYIDGVFAWNERFKSGQERLLAEIADRERLALEAQGYVLQIIRLETYDEGVDFI